MMERKPIVWSASLLLICVAATFTTRVTGKCVKSGTDIKCTAETRKDKAPKLNESDCGIVVTLEFTGYSLNELGKNNPFGETKFSKLETLNLTDNEIQHINASAFTHHSLPMLKRLILDDNKVTFHRSNRTFNNLKELEELSLNNALEENLASIERLKDSLTTVANITKLKILSLKYNKLTIIPTDMFDFTQIPNNRPVLETIDFSYNNIGDLDAQTFNITNLPHLKTVDLSSNILKTVDDEVLAAWNEYPDLTVDLSNNTWYCDCELKAFHHQLVAMQTASNSNLKLVGFQAYTCSPYWTLTYGQMTGLEGRKIVEVKEEELKCHGVAASPTSYLNPAYVVMGLLVAVISVCLLAVVYLRRHQIRQSCGHVWDSFKRGPYEGGYAGLEAGDDDDPEASEVFL